MNWNCNLQNNTGSLYIQRIDECLHVKHVSVKPLNAVWKTLLLQAFLARVKVKVVVTTLLFFLGNHTLVWALVSGSIGLFTVMVYELFQKTKITGELFLGSMNFINANQRFAFVCFWVCLPFFLISYLVGIGVPLNNIEDFAHLLLWSSYWVFNSYLMRLFFVLIRENLQALKLDFVLLIIYIVFNAFLFWFLPFVKDYGTVWKPLWAVFGIVPAPIYWGAKRIMSTRGTKAAAELIEATQRLTGAVTRKEMLEASQQLQKAASNAASATMASETEALAAKAALEAATNASGAGKILGALGLGAVGAGGKMFVEQNLDPS